MTEPLKELFGLCNVNSAHQIKTAVAFSFSSKCNATFRKDCDQSELTMEAYCLFVCLRRKYWSLVICYSLSGTLLIISLFSF